MKTKPTRSAHRFGFLLIAFCATLFLGIAGRTLAIPAPAQDQGSQFDLEGKITDLSPGKLTVSTEDNIIFHVSYNQKTQIHRKDGTAGSSKDLASGERIKVEGQFSPAGVIEAQSIELE